MEKRKSAAGHWSVVKDALIGAGVKEGHWSLVRDALVGADMKEGHWSVVREALVGANKKEENRVLVIFSRDGHSTMNQDFKGIC